MGSERSEDLGYGRRPRSSPKKEETRSWQQQDRADDRDNSAFSFGVRVFVFQARGSEFPDRVDLEAGHVAIGPSRDFIDQFGAEITRGESNGIEG